MKSKKALYESIMRNVAKEVKKSLNEYNGWTTTSTLDDFDDVELIPRKRTNNTNDDLFVDLGFPSGTLWCKYNLGCDFDLLTSNPENTKANDWYGNYYAWGEREGKGRYAWETYKYAKSNQSELTKYCSRTKCGYNGFTDKLKELLLKDDAAYQTNPSWKIPTKE